MCMRSIRTYVSIVCVVYTQNSAEGFALIRILGNWRLACIICGNIAIESSNLLPASRNCAEGFAL